MAAGPDPEDFSRIDAMVGARVRLLRERRKMSQTALGEAIGVSFQQVQKYERGANRISASALFLTDRGEAVTKPLVVRLDGNKAEEGRRILDSANNPLVERVDTMDGAAQRAAELAAAGV